jgi:hypothetical protein
MLLVSHDGTLGMARFDDVTLAEIEPAIRLKTAELASRRKQGALLQIRRRDHDDLAKRPRTLVRPLRGEPAQSHNRSPLPFPALPASALSHRDA